MRRRVQKLEADPGKLHAARLRVMSDEEFIAVMTSAGMLDEAADFEKLQKQTKHPEKLTDVELLSLIERL